MIKLAKEGKYNLVITSEQTKILILDSRKKYAWVNVKNIGEILVATKNPFTTTTVLASGNYRLYEVKDEPKLVDLMHLELFVGDGKWQGYLLTTGLPTKIDKRNRIIPTKEIITRTTH